MKEYDAQGTAALLPYAALVDALQTAALELASGAIVCPQRQMIPMPGGGAVLSMLAVAADLAVHKLVTVVPANRARGLPTIHGRVSVWDAQTGEQRLSLDGATVTGRRTAALSMLGIRALLPHRPRSVWLTGTGTLARHRVGPHAGREREFLRRTCAPRRDVDAASRGGVRGRDRCLHRLHDQPGAGLQRAGASRTPDHCGRLVQPNCGGNRCRHGAWQPPVRG
jgi:hypothetical protein